ncbi:uncharacterized protein [Coffea arabica]|uniref:Protein NYNRIN-like n=1 Tax=Coffea arabica TaxID=13443 RepID=A0ABM4VYZ4_COFAR
MEHDCVDFVRKCVKCQMHSNVIRAPPTELHSITAPWPCSIWGMDVIGTIDPSTSNGHRFILVAIKYFTKWVEAASYKHVTKKVVSNFLKNNIIYHFGYRKHLSLIMPRISTMIWWMDYVNISRLSIEILPFTGCLYALMTYKITIRTSTGATPYSLMYGMEAVLHAEVEIPFLHILMEAQIEKAEWVREHHEQLSLIDEKRLNAVCHGQCYQQRIA